MPNHSDLTFITNEDGQNLLERFKVLIRDTEFFDVLVGYFYTSGFHALYKSLEKTKKIRILIGIATDKATSASLATADQQGLPFSHAETKENFSDALTDEMDNAEDAEHIEEGAKKLIEWLKSGKIEIKAYPSERIHAKLYIMSFDEDDRDAGRVITGSSNFTKSGLIDNLEFNVELKNRADYDFALNKFNELWNDAVDVKETYLQTIREKTWLNDTITPYQLYLKFLFEYFQGELSQTDELTFDNHPPGFKQLEYQEQAVLNAKKILEEYGGVFLSDVVGLGKTYVSAMLAQQLDGRSLVLAPPVLLDESNPGSWRRVFTDFGVAAEYKSIGKLDQLTPSDTERYKNIFIDESHRFRTETNETYEKVAQICRGKRVILVTATPLNNIPEDILSQIKLFQNAKKSTIPNVPDLESFFKNLSKKFNKLDRKKDYTEYMRTAKENARYIREAVLKYLMVRRTRKEIETYFSDELKEQKLKFPEVKDPAPVFYQLNEQESAVFNETVALLANKFHYARYTPMLYYTGSEKIDQLEKQSQRNLGRFMKILLIKRLESSFYAFRNSIERFIKNYTLFIQTFDEKGIYISKKHSAKIFELLDSDDDAAIQELIEEDKAQFYPAEDFSDKLRKDLESDLHILQKIKAMWDNITRDPKLDTFVRVLSSDSVLKKEKIITFTESKETANYLAQKLQHHFPDEVIVFDGASNITTKRKVIENFDARASNRKDDYRILIATEVLSEGVNLHRSNVVINYDIPWNPTRLMQRVGRVNRLDTDFDSVYSFNFFPTNESDSELKLKEAAEAKIHAFISLLGADARLLTEGEEIESHELFSRLTSKKDITGEEEEEDGELKYFQIIKNIRDNDPDTYEQVKRLPKKARTSKKHPVDKDQLLTYFRKGKLQKFFLADDSRSQELDFMDAAKCFEAVIKTPQEKLPTDFYNKLGFNKQAFENATAEEETKPSSHGKDSGTKLLKTLKALTDLRQCNEEQEKYLQRVMNRLEEGALPTQTIRKTLKAIEKENKENAPDALKTIAIMQKNIPAELLEAHIAGNAAQTGGPREVILSEYMIAD